jgi:hypothetical protein
VNSSCGSSSTTCTRRFSGRARLWLLVTSAKPPGQR